MSLISLIKMTAQFLKATAFMEGEVSVTKTTFNPFKTLVFGAVLGYMIITTFALYKMSRIYTHVEKTCPSYLKTIEDYYSTGVIKESYAHRGNKGTLVYLCEFKEDALK